MKGRFNKYNRDEKREGVLDLVSVDEIKRKSVRGLLKKRAREYNSDEEI
jgi:hypothetical protein